MSHTPTDTDTLVKRLRDGCNLQQRDGERAADRIEALEAEVVRLKANHSRFPEAMAAVAAAKSAPLPERIKEIGEAMAEIPEVYWGAQWVADAKPAFGEKYVRHVAGDNGQGMGRQWLATTPPHIPGLARYIAAANPDTLSMMMEAITEALAGEDELREALAQYANPDLYRSHPHGLAFDRRDKSYIAFAALASHDKRKEGRTLSRAHAQEAGL